MSLNISQTSNFSPNQISGCYLWLDASTSNNFTFSSGSNISTWIDRSGNNYTATAANSPSYDSINDRVVFTAASSQYMSNLAAPLNLTNRSFFFVLQEITNTSVCGIMPIIPNPTTGTDYVATTGLTIEGTGGVYFYGNNGLYANRYSVSVPIAKGIYAETFSSLTGTTYLNGVANTSSNSAYTPGTSSGYGLGGRWSNGMGAPFFNGYMHEIVVFNNALSSSNRQIIEGYLAWKWGLQKSLQTSHPYYNTPVYSLNMPNVIFPLYNAPTSLFQPTYIPNCVLWLDAADPNTLFTDSAGTQKVSPFNRTVSHWKDKSPSGNNATNTTAQPTYSYNTLNKLNVINFNGAQYLTLSTATLPTGSTPCSFFFVVRTTSLGTQVFFTYGANPNNTNQNPQFFYGSGSLTIDTYGSSALSDSTNFVNSYVIVSSRFLTNASEAWDNGASFSGTPPAGFTLNTGTGWASLGVGRVLSTLNYYLTGQIAEVIIYNRAISTDERQQIEGYLAAKWALNTNLVAGHPYRTNLFETLPPFPTTTLINYGTNGVFDPRTIPNSSCTLWLDANDTSTITFSGTAVTAWRDKSGSNNNATATGTITRTGIINRKLGMNYPGTTSTYFSGAISNTGTTMSAFAVFTMNNTSYSSVRILSLAAASTVDFNNTLYTAAIERFSGNFDSYRASASRGSITAIFGSPVFVGSIYNGTNHTIYLNGTAGTTVAITGNFGYSRYVVGTSSGEESIVNLNGIIGEVIHYNAALTTFQRQQVEGYLAWKWGLQANLPSTHPYKLFPPPP
jgi:hypothetical protein